jgi:hypothetical protein
VGVEIRHENILPVFPREIIRNFLTVILQECDKPPVTYPELMQHVLLKSKCSMQQQHKELALRWWLHRCWAVCVVNASQSVGQPPQYEWWLSVDCKRYVVEINCNAFHHRYILYTVIDDCDKVCLLFWYHIVCNNMCYWELIMTLYKSFKNICILIYLQNAVCRLQLECREWSNDSTSSTLCEVVNKGKSAG